MVKTFEILMMLFQRLLTNRISIPDNFDYYTFGKAIRIGLESDHCIVLVKVLIFLYNNIPLFPKYVTARVVIVILKARFVSLFCHWSDIVRNVFHHLLWYRFYHIFSKLNSNIFDMNEIKLSIAECLKKEENYLKTSHCLIVSFF